VEKVQVFHAFYCLLECGGVEIESSVQVFPYILQNLAHTARGGPDEERSHPVANFIDLDRVYVVRILIQDVVVLQLLVVHQKVHQLDQQLHDQFVFFGGVLHELFQLLNDQVDHEPPLNRCSQESRLLHSGLLFEVKVIDVQHVIEQPLLVLQHLLDQFRVFLLGLSQLVEPMLVGWFYLDIGVYELNFVVEVGDYFISELGVFLVVERRSVDEIEYQVLEALLVAGVKQEPDQFEEQRCMGAHPVHQEVVDAVAAGHHVEVPLVHDAVVQRAVRD